VQVKGIDGIKPIFDAGAGITVLEYHSYRLSFNIPSYYHLPCLIFYSSAAASGHDQAFSALQPRSNLEKKTDQTGGFAALRLTFPGSWLITNFPLLQG
jgi:hypothetical protein